MANMTKKQNAQKTVEKTTTQQENTAPTPTPV